MFKDLEIEDILIILLNIIKNYKEREREREREWEQRKRERERKIEKER